MHISSRLNRLAEQFVENNMYKLYFGVSIIFAISSTKEVEGSEADLG